MGKVPGLLTLFMQGGRLGFMRDRVGYGPLVTGRPDPELTRAWAAPFLSDRGVRRDTRKLTAQVRPRDLADVGTRLGRFDRPVLLCWGAKDPFFKLKLAHRLQEAFPDARLVELEARTFVSVDQPERLAQEIAAFAAVSAGGS
jgi:pimeloyl-ACP methyl ester carboxylesterase